MLATTSAGAPARSPLAQGPGFAFTPAPWPLAARPRRVPDLEPLDPMHDPKFLRQHRDKVEAGIALKGVELDLTRFYQLEERRLALLHETEQLKARRNAASEDIAKLKKSGADASGPITEMRTLGDRVK